jgi:hypothetical protein
MSGTEYSVLLKVSACEVALHDLVPGGPPSLRLVVGEVVGLSALLTEATTSSGLSELQSKPAVALLTTLSASPHSDEVGGCAPGSVVVVPLAQVIVPPSTLSAKTVAAAISIAIRAHVALLCKANLTSAAADSSGGFDVFVLHAADHKSWAGYCLARRLMSKTMSDTRSSRCRFLLHTSNSKEYAEVLRRVEHRPADEAGLEVATGNASGSSVTTVLPPHEPLVDAVKRATGNLGADLILDLSDRRETWLADDEKALLPFLRPKAAELVSASNSPSSNPERVDFISMAIECLAPNGQLLTARSPTEVEIDRPLSERCRLKSVTIHWISESSWLDSVATTGSTRHMGTFLQLIQRIVQDASEGKLFDDGGDAGAATTTSAAAAALSGSFLAARTVEYPRDATDEASASKKTGAIRAALAMKLESMFPSTSSSSSGSSGSSSLVMLV